MNITTLDELSPAEIRAIVINVRTELVTTLALASIRKNADCPILLINCDPTESSNAYFDGLSEEWGFDVLRWPIRPHGHALDQLFSESKDTFLWLVDSDAEIYSPDYFPQMIADLRIDEGIFGAGFVHGPGWLSGKEKSGDGNAMYQIRPWIPCTGLRVSHMKEAIEHGVSFIDRTIREDLQRWIMKFSETDVDAINIDAIYCDTGADMYMWQTYKKERIYMGRSVHINSAVNHYHGVTRLFMAPFQENGVKLTEISAEIKGRLEIYDVNFDELANKYASGIVV